MKRVACIGQAPPRTDPERPFGRTKLYEWLERARVADSDISQFFIFGALVNFFPGSAKHGGHMAPTAEEIVAGREQLARLLIDFQPDVVVPIGKLSIQHALCLEDVDLQEVIGKRFVLDPYGILGTSIPVIPLPHPSGASAWYYKAANKPLLIEALRLLNEELYTEIS